MLQIRIRTGLKKGGRGKLNSFKRRISERKDIR